jgi:hypothetical protein
VGLNVMVKVLAFIGAGTLALMAFWVFIIIAAPNLPTQPPAEKIGSTEKIDAAQATPAPKLRDVTAQPHTTAVATTTPAAPVKPAAQTQPVPVPAPVAVPAPAATTPAAPAPAATTPAAPDPATPEATGTPTEPDPEQVASEPLEDPADAAAPAPSARPRHSANCTRYRTYDAATQTYRGFDGLVHPCRP